jgi:CDP-diacylglycerol--serine O-phosphatidyltransferase
VELRKLIPNMLTAAALICGCAAMYFADKGVFDKALAMIGVSFVLDGLDGRIARMLKATSRFGEKFDSIADFVAFGFAPAFIIFKWQLHTLNAWGLVLTAVYALCAAYRLARFTRLAKKKDVNAPVSKFFMGFPAPAASGAVLVPVMLQLSDLQWIAPVGATIAWTLLISFLMVSKLPMISVKHIKVNRKLALPIIMLFGAILLLAFRDAWLTFAGLAMIYALSLPVGWLLSRRSIRKEASEVALHQPVNPPSGAGRRG